MRAEGRKERAHANSLVDRLWKLFLLNFLMICHDHLEYFQFGETFGVCALALQRYQYHSVIAFNIYSYTSGI